MQTSSSDLQQQFVAELMSQTRRRRLERVPKVLERDEPENINHSGKYMNSSFLCYELTSTHIPSDHPSAFR